MTRTRIDLPEKFSFSCFIPIRISDINYGGHAGNDSILSIIHEARMQFLRTLGYTEMKFGGTGMIMTDVIIEFKSELFYGDVAIVSVAAGEISKVGFELFYKLEKETEGKNIAVAAAKTGMICYDYEKKKIAAVPDEVKRKISG